MDRGTHTLNATSKFRHMSLAIKVLIFQLMPHCTLRSSMFVGRWLLKKFNSLDRGNSVYVWDGDKHGGRGGASENKGGWDPM